MEIDAVRNYRIDEYHKRISFYKLYSVNKFQISRILVRPINKTEVIVKAASRKPKKLVIVSMRMKELNEICSLFIHMFIKHFPKFPILKDTKKKYQLK